MTTRPVPAPPEGLVTLDSGYGLAGEATRRDTVREFRVWAEGDWRVVTYIGKRFRRSLEVTYLVGEEDLPHNARGQRVAPERVAVPQSALSPRYVIGRQVQATNQEAVQARAAQAAARAQRPPDAGLLRIRASAQRELAADYRRMADEADQRAAELDQQADQEEGR